MLASRALGVLRAAKVLNRPSAVKETVRNSHTFNYRCGNEHTQTKAIYIAEGVQGFAWWWVLWHLWTEPGHIIGEFPYPDASEWTDEELGIPSE